MDSATPVPGKRQLQLGLQQLLPTWVRGTPWGQPDPALGSAPRGNGIKANTRLLVPVRHTGPQHSVVLEPSQLKKDAAS